MSSEKPSAKLHIDDEMKGTADFPLYGERIADILPPEHFLWQLQGSFPGFDDELAGMYRSQRSLKHISKASWPEDILIPGDFYMQGIVIPQLRGLLPPLSSNPEDHPETGTVEVQEEGGFEGQDEEAAEDFDPETSFPEEGEEEEWQDPVSGENFEQVVSSIQSRLAAGSWEVYKDVIAYPPEVFRQIVRDGEGLTGFIPKALLNNLHTLAFCLSFSGLDFELHGERCLGCFIFRGQNIAGGMSLNLGFVTKNSYYDYAIPLTVHASLEYIIESSTEFMAQDPATEPPMSEKEKASVNEDLKDAWKRVFPVIVHLFTHFPEDLSVRRRGSPSRAIMKPEGMNSPVVNYWKWVPEEERFRHDRVPALLKGKLRNVFLREFVEGEKNSPIEVAPEPGVPPTLN